MSDPVGIIRETLNDDQLNTLATIYRREAHIDGSTGNMRQLSVDDPKVENDGAQNDNAPVHFLANEAQFSGKTPDNPVARLNINDEVIKEYNRLQQEHQLKLQKQLGLTQENSLTQIPRFAPPGL